MVGGHQTTTCKEEWGFSDKEVRALSVLVFFFCYFLTSRENIYS